MAQGRSQVIQPQLFHQYTDAALGKASLVATAIRIFVKLHVPRVGVAVSCLQGSGSFHCSNILCSKLTFSALTAKPLHGRCHHGFCVVIRQAVHLRALRHGKDERPDHCTIDKIHFEAVTFFKFGQFGDDLFIFCFCLVGYVPGAFIIVAEYFGKLSAKRFCQQSPHAERHSEIVHFLSLQSHITQVILFHILPYLFLQIQSSQSASSSFHRRPWRGSGKSR